LLKVTKGSAFLGNSARKAFHNTAARLLYDPILP
jgi:hypothetical protein